MEMIYYTIAALVLYGLSDYILNSIEIKMGKRLPNRSFIFLIIITILAFVSFSLIRVIATSVESSTQNTTTTIKESNSEPVLKNSSQALPAIKKDK